MSYSPSSCCRACGQSMEPGVPHLACDPERLIDALRAMGADMVVWRRHDETCGQAGAQCANVGSDFVWPHREWVSNPTAQAAADLIDRLTRCGRCNGEGWTAEHDPMCGVAHGCEHFGCPIQVGCISCQGTGRASTQPVADVPPGEEPF